MNTSLGVITKIENLRHHLCIALLKGKYRLCSDQWKFIIQSCRQHTIEKQPFAGHEHLNRQRERGSFCCFPNECDNTYRWWGPSIRLTVQLIEMLSNWINTNVPFRITSGRCLPNTIHYTLYSVDRVCMFQFMYRKEQNTFVSRTFIFFLVLFVVEGKFIYFLVTRKHHTKNSIFPFSVSLRSECFNMQYHFLFEWKSIFVSFLTQK